MNDTYHDEIYKTIIDLVKGAVDFVSEKIDYYWTILEGLYLQYLNICNVPNQDNLDANEDVQNMLDGQVNDGNLSQYQDGLSDLLESTMEDLGGNQELIDRLYRADFKMVGYRRYKGSI